MNESSSSERRNAIRTLLNSDQRGGGALEARVAAVRPADWPDENSYPPSLYRARDEGEKHQREGLITTPAPLAIPFKLVPVLMMVASILVVSASDDDLVSPVVSRIVATGLLG